MASVTKQDTSMDFKNFDFETARKMMNSDERTESSSVQMRDQGVQQLQQEMGPDPVVPAQVPVNVDTAAAALEGGSLMGMEDFLDPEERMLVEAAITEDDLGGVGVTPPDYGSILEDIGNEVKEKYSGGYAETAGEWLTSNLIPFRQGMRTADALGDILNVSPSVLQKYISRGELQDKMFDTLRTMTPEDRTAALNRVMPAIEKYADGNNSDAREILNTVTAVFGTRSQAEASRDAAYGMDALAIGMEVFGAKGTLSAIRGLTKPVRKVAAGAASRVGRVVKKGAQEAAEDVSEDVAEKATKETLEDLAKQGTKKAAKEAEDVPAGLFRKWGVSPLTLMGRLSKAAPRVAEDVAEVASKDASVARRMGTTPDDVVMEYGLPKGKGRMPEEGPELYRPPQPEHLQEQFEQMLRHGYDELALSEKDVARMQIRADRVEELRAKGVEPSKSSIDYDPELGTLTAKYVIADRGGNPFSTAQEAVSAVQSRVGMSRVSKIEVLKADTGGHLKVVPQDMVGKGRFKVRVTYEDLAEDFVGADEVFRREGRAKTFMANALDSLVVFNKRLADTITSMDLRGGNINRELGEILKPFDTLPLKSKRRVFALLEKGAENGVEYSRIDAAKELGNNAAELDGYAAVRRMYNLSWKLRNRQFRDHLSRSGYFGLDNATDSPDIVRAAAGAERKRMVDEGATVLYKGQLISMKDAPSKAQLFEYHRPLEIGDKDPITHILMDNPGARISPLPEEVMNVSKGYMGRHLQMRYVVSDGDVAKGFFVNSDDARRFMDKTGNKYTLRRAQELGGSGSDMIEDELNTLADMGMLSHTKRRADPDLLMEGHVESLEDPVAILSKVTNQMARGITLDRPIQAMTNKWEKNYGKYMKESKFPWVGEMELKPELALRVDMQGKLKEAKAFATRIRLTSGRHEVQSEHWIRTKLRGGAEALSEIAQNQRKRASQRGADGDVMQALRKAGIFSASHASNTLGAIADPINFASRVVGRPMDSLKALGFVRGIVANPVKQRVMNSAQSLMYAGITPNKKAWTGQMQYILRRLNMGNLDKAAVKSGVHPKHDLSEQIIKEMEDSGLLASASTHDFLNASAKMNGSFAGKKAATFAGAVRSVEKASSKHGFEAGERVNLIGAYVAARDAAVAAGGSIDPKALAIRARQLAGNMGSYNRADWQPGWFGALSQFMSFGIRQAQLILPETGVFRAVANPAISGADKARFALFNTILWGANGWGISLGLRKMLEGSAEAEGIEVVPEVAEVVDKGMAGYVFDNTLEALFNEEGEEVNTNIGEQFAPFGPVTGDLKVGYALVRDAFDPSSDRLAQVQATTPHVKAAAIVSRMILQHDLNALEEVAGVPLGALQATLDIPESVWNTVSGNGIDSSEKFFAGVKHVASWAPVFNNAFKGRLMGASGKVFNRWGSPITDTNTGEAWATALLGVPPTSVQDFYDTSSRYNTQSAMKTPKNSELQQTGRDMASVFHRDYIWLENGEISLKDYRERQNAILDAVKETYGPEKFRLVQDSFLRQIDTLFEKSNLNASDALVKRIIDPSNRIEQGPERIIKDLKDLPRSAYRDYMIEFMESNK